MSFRKSSIWIATFLLAGGGASAFAGTDAPEKCAAAKTKASALAVSARLGCQAKAASKGTSIDPKCLQKAEAKLRASFEKAEAKGECLGDADMALGAAAACATAFSGAITGDGRCAAKKLKAGGAGTRDQAGCTRKVDAKRPACREKAATKLRAAIGKADGRGTCTGTADELGPLIAHCVTTLQPNACTLSDHPTCGGPCPSGFTCKPFETFVNGASTEAGCSCVDVANGPQCGGDVCADDLQCPDPGFVCERWKAGAALACDHSICQPVMVTPTTLPPAPENAIFCEGGEFPICGGSCPTGMRCQSFQGLVEGVSGFAACLCVDPTAPRCETTPPVCDIAIVPFSHCADPALTCIVTLVLSEARETGPSCVEAHCGVGIPTTTSTSNTTTTFTTTTTLPTTTSTTTSTTTTTLPCVSTPSVSGCFQDLGNCTILDTCTGLQWEQKGGVPGPHDVTNRYVWGGCCDDGCATMCQPNEAAAATCLAMAEHGTEGCAAECPTGGCFVERGGAKTTIFDWINQLNAENFGGHDDWRVPTEAAYNPTGTRELETIVQLPCSEPPCIDPIFGPTASAGYWSRTANVNRGVDAWYVDFFTAGYTGVQKREAQFVRAVR